jgi:hypothetical protein
MSLAATAATAATLLLLVLALEGRSKRGWNFLEGLHESSTDTYRTFWDGHGTLSRYYNIQGLANNAKGICLERTQLY